MGILEVAYLPEEMLSRVPVFPRYDTHVVLYQFSENNPFSHKQLRQMFPYAEIATFSAEYSPMLEYLSQSEGYKAYLPQDTVSYTALLDLSSRKEGHLKSDGDLEREREQLLFEFFSDFTHLVETSTLKDEFATALDELAKKIASCMNSQRCLFYLYAQGEGRFYSAFASADDSQRLMDFYFNNAILEEVLGSGVSYIDNSFEGKMADGAAKTIRVRSVLCFPLIKRTKRIGVLEVINKLNDGIFEEKDVAFLSRLASPLSVIIDNAMLFQNVEQLSYTDDVTKLYNSRYAKQFLNTEVKRSLRYKKKASLLFLDIDQFKAVNDVYGHLTGSETLMEMGKVLKNAVRETDIAVRYGGDEFVIVLPETPTSKAIEVAERIRTRVENYRFGVKQNLKISLTVSIGVATCPDHALTAEGLIQKADAAMYQAKAFSKNSTRVAV